MRFDEFVQRRIFDPLGMRHSTFYFATRKNAHLVAAYMKDKTTGGLTPSPPHSDFGMVGHSFKRMIELPRHRQAAVRLCK